LSTVVHTDDTPVPVWDPTLPQTRTGRFWVYVGDVRHPYVVYDYTPRRTRDGPEQFLKGFRGYLQADAFSGYDRMCAGPDVIEVACWTHVRRKFFESRTSAPVLAHQALARIRQLHAVEHAAKELSAEGRCALRQRDAVSLLTAFGGVVGRAGPTRAAQKPDRSGDRLRSVELGGALSLPRARGSEHRQ
jgi:transposase